jgi:23S rRNA (uracil1939-C5)-methyltransferase
LGQRKSNAFVVENLQILDAAAEGKALAKHDGKVVFIPYGAPGDVADVKITKQKSSFSEGVIEKLITPSPMRVEPVCKHFGQCGGCKWQHVNYQNQLEFKHRQVAEDIKRIAKVEVEEFLSIVGCQDQFHYRNKVEFTFSNKAWEEHFDKENPGKIPALGFHKPGMFDKILDLEECFLAPKIANDIRLAIKNYAIKHQFTFFDLRHQNGFLRNLMLRCNSNNEWMVVLIVFEPEVKKVQTMFDALSLQFPEVKEWCYVFNYKRNDSWSDLKVETLIGKGYLEETIENLIFKIRPQSFFQTNAKQALKLYQIAKAFAGLTGTENVYDLYTGTGSIALFVADQCKQVVGIEYVEPAVIDAKENAIINGIEHAHFYAGDMKLILNDELVAKHGRPDVIITDPPRDGMHPDVVKKIIELLPEKIVYVSCNSATQARDIALLSEHFSVKKMQPVDMFPNTHHVETVALLVKN